MNFHDRLGSDHTVYMPWQTLVSLRHAGAQINLPKFNSPFRDPAILPHLDAHLVGSGLQLSM